MSLVRVHNDGSITWGEEETEILNRIDDPTKCNAISYYLHDHSYMLCGEPEHNPFTDRCLYHSVKDEH